MSDSNSSGGIGFIGLLAIVFIVLKLTGYISWSWWMVTSPLWGSLLLSFVLVCGVIVTGFLINKRK
jgi:membrane protein YdbS with pleckstrin-like domain